MPAHATITALSVHSRTGGAISSKPCVSAAFDSAARIAPFAATPPATTSTRASGARSRIIAIACFARSASTSATAYWKLAAMSAAVRTGSAPVPWRATSCATAVFRPEKLKSHPARPSSGRGNANLRGSPPEQLRHLVERLARGIVHRAAQPHVPPDTLHRDALAVSAGNQQQQVGERHPALDQAGQPRGQRVRLQVVHRHIGQPVRDRDALGEQTADDQPADQPRAGAGRHASQIGEPKPRPRHHAAHLLGQERQMRARGYFRHHPAIRRVLALLAQHRLSEHAPALVHHRRRRLVARGLDAQHRAHSQSPIFPVARESNRTRP